MSACNARKVTPTSAQAHDHMHPWFAGCNASFICVHTHHQCTNFTAEDQLLSNADFNAAVSRCFRISSVGDCGLSAWDVSAITVMSAIFAGATSFNGDISKWEVSAVVDMTSMFSSTTAFNDDISEWDVSSVTSMSGMFRGAKSFNGDVSKWDVSRVKSMSRMFRGATAFNNNISKWDVSTVSSMAHMFSVTTFNGDISEWDVSSVTSMSGMFYGATAFKGDISEWDVSSVANMFDMFSGAKAFNADISKWDVSSVTLMTGMFEGATSFNYMLCGAWAHSYYNIESKEHMFDNSPGSVCPWSRFDDLKNFEGWNCGKITTCGKHQFCGGYNVKGKGSEIKKTFMLPAGTYSVELDFIKIDSWYTSARV